MKANNLKQNTKRSMIKKSVTAVMVLNMMYMSALPVVGNFDPSVATFAAGAATQATNITGTGTINPPSLALRSAILIEPSTGQVLLSMNPDEPLPPASMTKMMTEYIVAEQVKQGKLKWTDKVTVNENASKSIGSRIFLAQGDQHTVEELYIAMAVGSANDATVALAERVSGTEQDFVKLMNETAQKMGMKNTYFINSTGLDRGDMPKGFQPDTDRETVMTARDAATLAGYIIKDHPDYTRFTTIQSYKFRPTDKAPIINYNWMLEANKNITNFRKFAYPGLDGMKTGHTANAGNCFTGTAERNGMRLISVVMGADSDAHRFTETAKVLNYGFDNFEVKQVIAPKTVVKGVENVPVTKGTETEVPIVTKDAVSFIVPKGASNPKVTFTTNITPASSLVAPLKQGAKVGTITYTYKTDGVDKGQTKTVDLVTTTAVEESGWFRMLFRAIGDFFGDLFQGIKNLF
ncbi:D-alanyl-D-alanine carboxypeptidase (penicillin-binding protein 5/6) [Paenibacillus polymyxa]|uniref:D-alanyl-D-alanine carboxypeptidase family protein n=1 Tax=Paenibacillus polymyxa TaxID=1406 RepID=UPI0027915686|nr:D-alanyl-D-alanine carboxypeptidase family protein [Paenibacillus polymyxa]MDQ0050876.1 D-alanyl-D-alanine carboxypeptidase (penicillin-binding protein 5/6) [Paenibacillus polymyxa]